MKKCFLVLSAVLISGCLFTGCAAAERVADRVADGVIIYCGEPLAARQLVRDTVNQKLAGTGHRVRVTCAGDPAN